MDLNGEYHPMIPTSTIKSYLEQYKDDDDSMIYLNDVPYSYSGALDFISRYTDNKYTPGENFTKLLGEYI